MPTTTPLRHAGFPPWSQSPDSVHPIFGDARLGIVPFARGDEPQDDPEREKLMKELVSDLQVATAELDVQANALHDALNHINNQRKRCKRLLGQRNTVNSPVLWVTDDVLSIIFDFCLDTSPWSRNSAVNRTLLTLSHVCESWRRILKDSPVYWKNTGVGLQIDPQQDISLPLLNMFLERVRSHPFSVRVVPRKLDDKHSAAFGNTVHLWRTLELVQYGGPLERSLGYFGFPRPAGALETLDFLLILDEGDTTRFFQPFEQCQNLRDLKLRLVSTKRNDENGPPCLSDIAGSRFPWAQLTKFHLDAEYPAGDILNILRACHQLQELRLLSYCTKKSDWEVPCGESIYMPKLVKLSVPTPNFVLFAVRCPALEILELGCLAECEAIDKFLARSRPTLKILRIKTDTRILNVKVGDGCNEICSHFPSIDMVAFTSYDPQLELPIFLVSGPNASPLLPSCKHFHLDVDVTITELCTPEFSTLILAFIDARWHAAERYLESVTLTAIGDSEDSIVYAPREKIRSMPFLEKLGAYQREGLKVTVCAEPDSEGGLYYYMC